MALKMKHPDAFKCSCGAEFFRYNEHKKKMHPCPECKGMGKLTKEAIRPKPIWKEVVEKKAFCPKCGWEMKRTTGDVATMFDYQCGSLTCHYVC